MLVYASTDATEVDYHSRAVLFSRVVYEDTFQTRFQEFMGELGCTLHFSDDGSRIELEVIYECSLSRQDAARIYGLTESRPHRLGIDGFPWDLRDGRLDAVEEL